MMERQIVAKILQEVRRDELDEFSGDLDDLHDLCYNILLADSQSLDYILQRISSE